MHPKAVEAIRREIGASLVGAEVRAGETFPMTAQAAFPHIKRYIERALSVVTLKRHLRGSELISIYFEGSQGVVRSRLKKPPESDTPLKDVVGDDGLQEIEESIIGILESIPRQYIGYF